MAVLERSGEPAEGTLELLLDWRGPGDRARQSRAWTGSVLLHVLAIAGLLLAPVGPTHPAERLAQLRRIVTPLIAPPTQKEPQRGAVSKEFDIASLRSREQVPSPPPALRRPTVMQVPVPGPVRQELPEPPKPDSAAQQPPVVPQVGLGTPLPPPPAQIQAEERKPKLAFETPGSPSGNAATTGRLAVPSTSVDEAIRQLSRSGRTGALVVGDAVDGGSGLGPAPDLSPGPGKTQSAVQLLSDPMGVDFKPYLIQVLAAVRRNWRAVIPESARLGQQRGRVSVQFAVARNGYVVKLVYSGPSGITALDRAAVAGISASNPFPPLPGDFKGDQVRLQLTFLYNVQ